METRDIRSEFPGSGRDRDEHQKLEKEGKCWKERWGTGKAGTRRGSPDYVSPNRRNRQLPKMYRHRNSVLPLQWKITHSSRWKTQLLASELSLIAFILLLVMVFSKKWLYISACRFYQQWPTHLRNKIYTSAHIMSMGLLQICTSKNCLISENGKEEEFISSHRVELFHWLDGVYPICHLCIPLLLQQ
uniref:Outer dense fiber of sperm tails 4 n=1 Tax=Molossus molossus TaxID=27622 RepID=A0A7J8D0S8_MOLMO|nr:outer dense fiber of sperm tails 4 [Molossus molossus]